MLRRNIRGIPQELAAHAKASHQIQRLGGSSRALMLRRNKLPLIVWSH